MGCLGYLMPVSSGARDRAVRQSKTSRQQHFALQADETDLRRNETQTTNSLKTAVFFGFFQLLEPNEEKFDMVKWYFMVDALYLGNGCKVSLQNRL